MNDHDPSDDDDDDDEGEGQSEGSNEYAQVSKDGGSYSDYNGNNNDLNDN